MTYSETRILLKLHEAECNHDANPDGPGRTFNPIPEESLTFDELRLLDSIGYRPTSLEERLIEFRKNRKPCLWDDFYGLQSSCLLTARLQFEKLK